MASATGGTLTVTQIKSAIGTKPKHRGTLRALGLHGIGTTNTRVPHLILVQAGGAPAEEAR